MEIEEVEMYLEELSYAGLGTNLLNADPSAHADLKLDWSFVNAKSPFRTAGHYV